LRKILLGGKCVSGGEHRGVSGLGGLIGIGAGVGTAKLLSRTMNLDVVFSPDVILLAFGFSMTIGVVFGIFPANKASNLKPIEALRFE
jgi:putative ABC transport system permease protein